MDGFNSLNKKGLHDLPRSESSNRCRFNAMADHIVQPNVFAYSACISAYEKMGRWKEPLELQLGFFVD